MVFPVWRKAASEEKEWEQERKSGKNIRLRK